MAKNICFPFCEGSLQEFVYRGLDTEDEKRVYSGEEVVTDSGGHDIVWKPKEYVELTVDLERYARGRSAITFYVTDENDNEYPMFVSDFFDIVHSHYSFPLHGIFTYVKKGRNYGLQFVGGTEINGVIYG